MKLLTLTGILALVPTLFGATGVPVDSQVAPPALTESMMHAADVTPLLAAQVLKNTVFSERTPGFNDLYMIETPDKGRQIVIYCNPTFCYKLRGHTLTA